MRFSACLTLVCCVTFSAATLAQQAAAPFGNKYKRVHQELLKQIVDGQHQKAIKRLRRLATLAPTDAETQYMLAVATTAAGQLDAAAAAAQRAMELGMPADRFLAGRHSGLEPIRDRPELAQLAEARRFRPAHGPMLGGIQGSRLQVWLRTLDARGVQVVAWPKGHPDQRTTSPKVQTVAETDYAAVLRLDGLQSNTEYHYEIQIDGNAHREPHYHFRTLADTGKPVRFRVAFGGGAGFVPHNERMWNTIRDRRPDALMLLGDNVYSDAPEMPEMQHYCYYRRQSRPEYRRLVGSTPVFAIWDDHDFGTNDCSGGPAIDQPVWKPDVYRVFRNNWVNAYYGGGETQPGCYFDFHIGDVHFVMLDGRYYRDLNARPHSTMLGPVQCEWLQRKIQNSNGRLLVLCSPVPWVFEAKGDSRDTWNGFREERAKIFGWLKQRGRDGVMLMSADRHRSDLWKIDVPGLYPLYEFNSSRLTNQHVHKEMAKAVYSYNKKQSFGTLDFDTTQGEPTVDYRIWSIDGEQIFHHRK